MYNFVSLILTWFGVLLSLWIVNVVYAFVTCRTKIVKVISISQGLKTHCIIDSNSSNYYVMSNHYLGVKNLKDKLSRLILGESYEIKIYGFETLFTNKRLIDIKPC